MTDLEFLKHPEVKEFIHENESTDPHKLLLNPPAAFKERISLIVDQIISRKKTKTKLPDWYNNTEVILPPPISIEQCSSSEAAVYKKNLLSGKYLVDLTGGMGVDCLTLSENFNQTTYVEQNEWLCRLFEYNAKAFGKSVKVINGSAEDFLNTINEKVNIFIDPARRDNQQQKVFRFEDCTPNMAELIPQLKAKADKVLVKASPLIDISQGIKSLRSVTETHVLSIQNEVKEVLFLMDFGKDPSSKIICSNLGSSLHSFKFDLDEEKKIEIQTGALGEYLYDPNASILKAGAFRSIASRYQLRKLSNNTHLYTSQNLIENFPGRIFKVVDIVNKKNIKKLLPNQRANIITKNYPLKPEELKQRYKLKDGGEDYLMGYRDANNAARLIKCIRIK